MATLKSVPQTSIAAAQKAERERDKIKAMQDYQAKRKAAQANMVRLRELRLAQERTASVAPKGRKPAKGKKTAAA